MLEHERTCTQRGHSEEGSYTKRLGLIISRSFFLGQLPSLVVPSPFFNLAFILPHSQYHPQSVSTLQHSARVSHLSLSQPLALSSSLSLSLSRVWHADGEAESKVLGSRLNPVSERLRMLSQTFPIPPFSPRTTTARFVWCTLRRFPTSRLSFYLLMLRCIWGYISFQLMRQTGNCCRRRAGGNNRCRGKRAIRRGGDGGETRGLQSTTGA